MFHGLIQLILLVQWFGHAKCPDKNKVENQYIIKVKSSNINSSKLTPSNSEYTLKSVINRTRKSIGSLQSKLSQNYETLVVETRNIDSLKEDLQPEYTQQDCYVEIFSISSDPLSVYQNWYLESLNANGDFNLKSQKEVIVAVVDTGIDIRHEDLRKNIWTNTLEFDGVYGFDDDGNGFVDDIYGYDIADNDNDIIPTRDDLYLDFDHGTHVAGLIGATYDNNIGVMGLSRNQVKLMPVKVLHSNADTPLSDLLKGVYYAVDNGAHIINLSLGGTKPAEQAEIDAINYALSQEVLVVAAAGNDTEPASWTTPASIPGVITVGSLNSQDQLSTFSNYGASVNFVAPGGDGKERFDEVLLNSVVENNYYGLRGTSMASPLIAGSLALLMSQRSDLTPFMALKALKATSNDLKLRPYIGRGEQIYKKPNIEQALIYIRENQNIERLDPRILTVVSDLEGQASTGLSSNLKSNNLGGCGPQSSISNSELQSPSFIVILLLIFPSMLTLWLRRKNN